jgi:alkylhydroperoxidase/carboxymuconolactone decarboxylase family protein YurZ
VAVRGFVVNRGNRAGVSSTTIARASRQIAAIAGWPEAARGGEVTASLS